MTMNDETASSPRATVSSAQQQEEPCSPAATSAPARGNLLVDVSLTAPQAWPLSSEYLAAIVSRAARAAWHKAKALSVPEGAEERPVSLHVLLADDETIRPLNAAWRGKDAPTNVLSFPAPPVPVPPGEPMQLGEIVLSGEVIAREAEDAGVPLEDQLAWMVVHGTLHILGYDHENAKDQAQMQALESAIMKHLGYDDPHAEA